MRLGRPVTRIVLSPSERETLERYTRRATTAQGLALRARIVLRCAAGETHTAIAVDLHVTKQTVGKWRRRFVDARVPGLLDELGDAEIERVLTTTLESTPPDATHWSTRSLAKQVGLTYACKLFVIYGPTARRNLRASQPCFDQLIMNVSVLDARHPPYFSNFLVPLCQIATFFPECLRDLF